MKHISHHFLRAFNCQKLCQTREWAFKACFIKKRLIDIKMKTIFTFQYCFKIQLGELS